MMFCSCPKPSRNATRQGLAMTPTDVYNAYKSGVPIALPNSADASYYAGDRSESTYVPVEHRRSVDINAAWESQYDIRHYQKNNDFKVKFNT